MTYECDCDDGDPPAYYRRTSVKSARNEYRCEECRLSIRRGEPYERVEAKWEEHCTITTCQHCVGLREWAIISVPCFCYNHGDLLADIKDMVRQVTPDVPGFDVEYAGRLAAIEQARSPS